jgi:hypothetical protein
VPIADGDFASNRIVLKGHLPRHSDERVEAHRPGDIQLRITRQNGQYALDEVAEVGDVVAQELLRVLVRHVVVFSKHVRLELDVPDPKGGSPSQWHSSNRRVWSGCIPA